MATADEPPLPRLARRVDGEPDLRPLSSWRSEAAYVLLGDPGAGKSTSFDAEARAQGAVFVEASDIADDVASADGLRDQVVFIDGLDQIKANGRGQGTGALGSIRKWLARAKPAGFRLSCREADWRGAAEQDELARVAPDGRVTVLQLEPLTEDEALVLLRRRAAEIGDARAFLMEAEARQLTALFGNPLLLNLMVDAVAERGSWPRSRSEIYAAACERLVRETSEVHLAARPPRAGHDAELLHTAGLLCALLLLSGKSAVVPRDALPSTLALEDLPVEFELPHAAAALATKAFVAPAGQAQPRHRSIAEYLAARSLARLLDEGLPLGRVLALMLGFDGKPVEALRGLLAWLAVEHLPSRSRLLRLDPLGFILNGDPARLSTAQRPELLQALAEQAAENPWFRSDSWQSRPLGALVTVDMAPQVEAILRHPQRDYRHQAFIDCLLDALLHSDLMPSLSSALAAWVADPAAFEGNRVTALQAWQRHCPEAQKRNQERLWLDAMRSDQFSDPTDRLLGALLHDAYPERVAADEVLNYLRARRDGIRFNRYTAFWHWDLIRKARPGDAATLVDQWLQLLPREDDGRGRDELWSLGGMLLGQALRESGDGLSDARLYEWLAIGLNRHGAYAPSSDDFKEAVTWLTSRSERMYGVLRLGYEKARPKEVPAWRHFGRAEARLLGAKFPKNHPKRLLNDFCALTPDPELAGYLFRGVAAAVVSPAGYYEVPNLEELAEWAELHHQPLTPFLEWLCVSTTWDLDCGQAERYRAVVEERIERAALLAQRCKNWSARLLTLDAAVPDISLVHEVALAMQARTWELQGDLPEERVQDLLGTDAAVAGAAIDAVHGTLARPDLPSAAEVFVLLRRQHEHLLQGPALIAADRTSAADLEVPLSWTASLCETLTAFYLVGGAGETPFWYRQLSQARPQTVTPVLLEYLRLAPPDALRWSLLCALCGEEWHEAVTTRLLPELVRMVPGRLAPQPLADIDAQLLSVLPRLPSAQASNLVAEKLRDQALNPRVRLSWLVANLRYSATAVDAIQTCVSSSRPRRLAMAAALHRQGVLLAGSLPNAERVLKVLISLLAPLTPQRSRSDRLLASNLERRQQELVSALFSRLAQLPSAAAMDSLRELVASGLPNEWQLTAEYSLQAQRSAMRQARFEVPSPYEVALTLANKSPAHQADLRELLLDHLDTISQELRGSNSFALSQFWNGEVPRDENDCRNLLLEKLRVKMNPLSILVEPEVTAADLKRMDLKLTFTVPGQATLSLPVEAKKDSHKDLWTAWRDQLQRLYAIDPAASGYGVYLVFWFGHKTQCRPGASVPDSADQLREELEAAMDEPARQHIAVYVLDLSWVRRH